MIGTASRYLIPTFVPSYQRSSRRSQPTHYRDHIQRPSQSTPTPQLPRHTPDQHHNASPPPTVSKHHHPLNPPTNPMLSYVAPTVQQFRSSLSSPFPTDPPSRPPSTAPPTFGTAGYSYNPSRTSSVVSGRQSAAQVQVQAQAQHPPSLQRSFGGDSEYGQIPALSALASLAANAPAAVDTRSIGRYVNVYIYIVRAATNSEYLGRDTCESLELQ